MRQTENYRVAIINIQRLMSDKGETTGDCITSKKTTRATPLCEPDATHDAQSRDVRLQIMFLKSVLKHLSRTLMLYTCTFLAKMDVFVVKHTGLKHDSFCMQIFHAQLVYEKLRAL